MADKRVSVRLAATGGRQVKAELEGVGEAGKRGFGRLSREMDEANRRLAGFARRAKVAVAAAASALVAAAGAMIRSGLQVVDAQAKLAASLATTTESVQVLGRAGDLAGVSMGEIEQATMQLTRRLAQAAQGTGPAVEALQRLNLTADELRRLPLDQRIAAIQDALAQYVPEAQLGRPWTKTGSSLAYFRTPLSSPNLESRDMGTPLDVCFMVLVIPSTLYIGLGSGITG
jgi:hypothetical protein